MRVLLAALTLLLAACPAPGSNPAPTGGGTTGGAIDNAGGAPPPAPGVCTMDADCVISCARPNECCDQLCEPCEQAWHRDLLAEQQAWKSGACDQTECPVARCKQPTERTTAVCREGACVVEREPL